MRGAIPAHDPTVRPTIDAIERELVDEGFVYRFRHDYRPLAETEAHFCNGFGGDPIITVAQIPAAEFARVTSFREDRFTRT